jgi:hypothetical protein
MSGTTPDRGTIRLGLNIPLFVASLISIGVGTFTGMVGIWGYAAQSLVIPEWIKTGHAHAAWWSALILLAAVVVPSLPLASWFRKFLLATAFICPTAWVVLGEYAHYGLGVEWAMYLMPVFEITLFIALLGTALTASGVKLPLVTAGEAKPGRYDILSPVEVDRRIFLVPTLVATVGVITGYAVAGVFKAAGKPVTPAALVQLHDHLVLISTSAVISLLALRILNVSEGVFRAATRIMEVSLPLVALGLLVFVATGANSLVWVIPAGIYYLLPVLAFLAAVGALPRAKTGELPYLSAARAALAFTFAMILVLVAVGAYIGLVWDTTPNVTVTFKQPEGVQYPGPYPAKFLGTAPVKGTPRGLENAHLSPGSWSHVAAMWIITLILVATTVFNELLKKPGLLYMFLVTIPLAPAFNMAGRFLAWWPDLPAGAPGGIGALWYAGHPIKGFNIISLFILGLVLLYMLGKAKK